MLGKHFASELHPTQGYVLSECVKNQILQIPGSLAIDFFCSCEHLKLYRKYILSVFLRESIAFL
jgi:hypothetical protein